MTIALPSGFLDVCRAPTVHMQLYPIALEKRLAVFILGIPRHGGRPGRDVKRIADAAARDDRQPDRGEQA